MILASACCLDACGRTEYVTLILVEDPFAIAAIPPLPSHSYGVARKTRKKEWSKVKLIVFRAALFPMI